MLMSLLLMALATFAQQQAPAEPAKPGPTVINARLGGCAADFTVTDADGKPVFDATVHVLIRYGFMSVKRMDLEVGTNADGKARVEGLPEKAKPLVYDITKGETKGTAAQNLQDECKGIYAVTLK